MAVQYYIKGKYPAFLTFSKQTAVIEELEATGAISYEDFCQMGFSPAITKRINKQVKKHLADLYLTDPNEYINRYYSFSCVGEEARDNLFRLLDAAGALYR